MNNFVILYFSKIHEDVSDSRARSKVKSANSPESERKTPKGNFSNDATHLPFQGYVI